MVEWHASHRDFFCALCRKLYVKNECLEFKDELGEMPVLDHNARIRAVIEHERSLFGNLNIEIGLKEPIIVEN